MRTAVKKPLFLLLAVVAAGVFAGTAVGSCNPGRSSADWPTNVFDGWLKDPPPGTCFTGVLSNILVYSPYVAKNDTTAWVMIANGVTGSYGQIGWLQQTGARFNFTESSTAHGGFQQRLLGHSPLGTSHYFKVTYSGGGFHYFLDDVNVDTDTADSFTGCEAQNFAEVMTVANQMPGGYNSHEPFANTEVRRSDTNTWFYIDGTPVNDRTQYWGNSKTSSTRDEVWDLACST